MEEHPAIKTADQVPVGWFERYVPSLSEFVEVIELASFYTPIDPALLRLGEVYEVRIVERYGRDHFGDERDRMVCLFAVGYDYGTWCRVQPVAHRDRGKQEPAADAEPERWFYAHHPDDEEWSDAGSSREEAIAEARAALNGDIDAAVYIVRGERASTSDITSGFSIDHLLDHLIGYAADNALIGEDTELTFRDQYACEREVRQVLARHLERPNYWACHGSEAEEVRLATHLPAKEPA